MRKVDDVDFSAREKSIPLVHIRDLAGDRANKKLSEIFLRTLALLCNRRATRVSSIIRKEYAS